MMKIKKYNIIIAENTGANLKQVSLSLSWLWVFSTAFLLICAATSFFVFSYLERSETTFEAEQLFKEQKRLEARVFSMRKQLEGTVSKVKKVQNLMQEIRTMTRMNAAGQLAVGPMKKAPAGGSSLELESFVPTVESHDPSVESIRSELVDGHIEGLQLFAMKQQDSLFGLKRYFSERSELLAATPSIWPATGFFSSNYGYRRDPFTGISTRHAGLDISAAIGTPIYAPANAKVTYASKKGGYGNFIELTHGRGISTRYGHLSRYFVKLGEEVHRGQLIGHIGNTGRSTGPHLHYEVRINGEAVNPRRYIVQW